ncbi:MAG TPA: protein-methionine-sulfoxide reductase catalytic subunit MsrP [Anaerolineaceae bacterium]|jgi:sulfoxide reductase catalytic subunit YedY|nr:protein-methionine-sulfoxide reductase catalytic subunit MsrP [Anaerolineaceae bacterium]
MRKIDVPKIPSSEITPEQVYLNRRQFIKLAAVGAAGSLLAACGVKTTSQGENTPTDISERPRDELGDPANSFEEITNYNNYYEFTMVKEGVASLAKNFPTSPWQVEVGGLVHKPRIFDMDDLRRFPQEERVYRLRCVEGWSMVIPWLGFPLSLLLKEVEPMTSAAFVKFTTIVDRENMPGVKSPFYPWPYTEGLRLDEAYHDLTLLVTGLYGKDLLPQNGAPLRLAVPWKYGFKSSKAIVKIELTESTPPTFWNIVAPNEYGFYANVNPQVPHPRWSQATERRIGENRRRETLLFNGYAEQVGQLYANMDLRVNY